MDVFDEDAEPFDLNSVDDDSDEPEDSDDDYDDGDRSFHNTP